MRIFFQFLTSKIILSASSSQFNPPTAFTNKRIYNEPEDFGSVSAASAASVA